MFCPKCGASNIDAASFCAKCGNSLTELSAWVLAAKPWLPIATLEQARKLKQIGVVSLAIAGALTLIAGMIAGTPLFALAAAVYGICALGAHFDWRIAAAIGCGWLVFNVVLSLITDPALFFSLNPL
jgi:hypothetical protein